MTRMRRLVLCALLNADPNVLMRLAGSPWTKFIALVRRKGRPFIIIPCIAALNAVKSPPLVKILSPVKRPTSADPFMPAHFMSVI